MSQINSMPLHKLAFETSVLWEPSANTCDDCHGPLYEHLALEPLKLSYERCPSCHLNYVQRANIFVRDKNADRMLDELVRRSPVLTHQRKEKK